jgi:outer membrane protein
MYNRYRLPCYCIFLLVTSGCYLNKAIVQPWTEDFCPSSPSDYWTPSEKAKTIHTTVPLPLSIPSTDQPLNLGTVMDIALSNNTTTQMSWSKARQAAALYGQSQSPSLPSLIGMYEFFRTRAASFTTSNLAGGSTTGADTGSSAGTASLGASGNQVFVELFNQFGPQFNLRYTLFDFGKNSATAHAAQQALYFADYNHNRQIQTVINQVTTDYYTTLYEQQLLQADKENVQTALTTLDAAEVAFQSGTQNLSDVLQAKTELLQFQISLSLQKQQVVASTSKLLTDMGLPASLPIALEHVADINPEQEELPSLEELIAVGMQSRPDFLAAGADLRSKELSFKAAKRQILPNLVYNLDFGKTYFSGGVNDKYDYTSYFNLSMPLFQGYNQRNNMKVAESNRDLSETQLKAIELQLVQEVTNARNNVQVAFDALRYSKEYLASAQKQYEISMAEYKRGTADILSVVAAQSSLADARARLAQNTQGWFTALANLTFAIGGAASPPASIIEEFQ